MAIIAEDLAGLLKTKSGAPFLFVGSGFSRRYLGLEQWAELLERFCEGLGAYGKYASQNNNDLPATASAIARDFNEYWWSNPKYSDSVKEVGKVILTDSSAMKYEISRYLIDKVASTKSAEELKNELDCLSGSNIDGVITTNWDTFLEQIFPDYRTFIGQEELLFSTPQSIAEIYKIHGCVTEPETLVLTKEDYNSFQSKNAYLAAKLLTIFIEHPVIFIGYSLADENIQSIIRSIVACLNQEKLQAFGSNLIFVQRLKKDEVAGIFNTIMAIDALNFQVTVVKTNDFLDVYKAFEDTKRKIPVRILRYCKEQMYELVKSADPTTKLSVVGLDDLESAADIEFVVGVGVAEFADKIGKRGYRGVALDDIFLDLLRDNSEYDAAALLTESYPILAKRANKYIPVYRYLKMVGIGTAAELKASKYAAMEPVLKKSIGSKPITYVKQYKTIYSNASTAEIIDLSTPDKAAIMIPFQSHGLIDLPVVRNFLLMHKEKFKSDNSVYATYYRKLACLYDKLKFGF